MSQIYNFNAARADGEIVSLSEYKNKLLLIVNTASKCGYTPQYKGLQFLYDTYHAQGLEILAFPCNQFGNQEPGMDDEIQKFCQVNYSLTFPVFAKIDVNGEHAHPLYRFLRSQVKSVLGEAIQWNFTKFLVDRHGNVFRRYESKVEPKDIAPEIEKALSLPSI